MPQACPSPLVVALVPLGLKGETGSTVTVVSLPAEDGPRDEARPQAGLEVVEKLLTSIEVRLCTGSDEA
jgi:hypothetical protein